MYHGVNSRAGFHHENRQHGVEEGGLLEAQQANTINFTILADALRVMNYQRC